MRAHMPQEPASNDYLNWVRALHNEACTKLEQDIDAAERQFAARAQAGALIRKTLDLGKQHFDRNVNSTFREMHRLLSKASFARHEVTEPTVRELTNLLNRTKKVILGTVKRRVRGHVGTLRLIDQQMLEFDRSLQLKTRQTLPDLVEPAKLEPSPAYSPNEINSSRPRIEVPFAAFFESTPSFPHESVAISAPDSRGKLVGSKSLWERAQEAELLVCALHQSVSEELERIKTQRRDEADAALLTDCLTNVTGVLGQIATILRGDCVARVGRL